MEFALRPGTEARGQEMQDVPPGIDVSMLLILCVAAKPAADCRVHGQIRRLNQMTGALVGEQLVVKTVVMCLSLSHGGLEQNTGGPDMIVFGGDEKHRAVDPLHRNRRRPLAGPGAGK